VIVNFITPRGRCPRCSIHTREGSAPSGKDPATLDVVCRIILAVDEDDAVTRNLFRRSLTAYVTVPQVQQILSRDWLRQGSRHRDRRPGTRASSEEEALDSIPDDMVEKDFGVFGQRRERMSAPARRDTRARGNYDHRAQFASFAKTPEERRTNDT